MDEIDGVGVLKIKKMEYFILKEGFKKLHLHPLTNGGCSSAG
ncbi:hypothetical protein [Sediminicola sp. 1XM1-17]